MYKTQYDKCTKTQKKRIKVQNIPENLPIDLHLDEDEDENHLPPLEDDEEETTAERAKSSKKKLKHEVEFIIKK